MTHQYPTLGASMPGCGGCEPGTNASTHETRYVRGTRAPATPGPMPSRVRSARAVDLIEVTRCTPPSTGDDPVLHVGRVCGRSRPRRREIATDCYEPGTAHGSGFQ